ncbi:MAG: DNA internalization-related competence protein ComEC/Rec2 [Myxococcota bacterium]
MHASRLLLPGVALAWLVGRALSAGLGWVALASLAVSVAVAYVGRHARARSWGALLLVAATGAGSAHHDPEPVDVPPGLTRLEGEVVRVRYGASARSTIRVDRAERLEDGASWPDAALVDVWDADHAVGARIQLLARVQPRTRFRNPTPHPAWMSSPVAASARVEGRIRVVSEPWAPLHHARRGLRQRLSATLPPHAAGVARALLLGDGGAVDEESRDALRGAGLAHLLAVSGLHVALVAGFVVLAARRLLRGRVRDVRRVSIAFAIPASVGFALMAGGAPSAWRAATMASTVALLAIARRRPDPLAVVALAVIVFSFAAPEQALRPGFLLSVLATVAIVTSKAAKTSWESAWRISVRTTLATAPLVLWCFGGVPLVGVLANVVLVPVAAVLVVPLAFLHALAASVGLEVLTADLFVGAVDALRGAASLAALPGWGMDLPPLSVPQGWIVAVAAALMLRGTIRQRVVIGLLAGLAIVGTEIQLRRAEQPTGVLRITQLDVAQGDGALVDLPDGSALLVDAGGGIPDPGERALLPLFEARRRREIRLAVISHPHPDHYQGLRALVERGVTIREVWDSGQAEVETPHGPAAALLRLLRRQGTQVRTPQEICGLHELGGATLEVLWPCPAFDAGFGPNDNSLVVRVRYGERAVLFTGDIEALAEDALTRSNLDLRADVLKVPHHGSRTSSSRAFLERVMPSLAIASCGRHNRFGHPHGEITARYAALGISLLRTDRDGGVMISTDGQTPWGVEERGSD